MRKSLLTAILAPLFLISSCVSINKCRNPKYVYKEGEHPEVIMPPKLPTKPTEKDFTFNISGPNNELALSPYKSPKKTYIAGVQDETKEVEINIYPSRKNNWVKKIQNKEEKVLVAKYDINLKEESKNLEYRHPGIIEGPFVIYNGSEDTESVFAEVSRAFPQCYMEEDSITGKRLYLFPENFAGSAADARIYYNQGLEYAVSLEEKEKEVKVLDP